MDDIQKTQRSFALKALNQKGHRFDDLYHLICRRDWIEQALNAVLDNTGSRTAGVDGITRKSLAKEKDRLQFITQLQADLKASTYQPQPVERRYIPKASGGRRPLGIPTLRDRVVQMLIKMLFEPIWESDFYDFSNGFRPERRTMDCIGRMYRYINHRNKYFWVIEGDIKGCFDHINHAILMREVKRRVADTRVLNLVSQFLKAGVMEERLFQRTEEGTPQGGVVSPLLANIYLHRFDEWWWKQYGSLPLQEKRKRREGKQGNSSLLRYADDFIFLWNGDKAGAEQLREEVRQFLAQELHLELSLEKTHVTHVSDGFDFLGFHIKYYTDNQSRPTLCTKPSLKNIERLKHKVLLMTSSKRVGDNPEHKFVALNRLLHGWIGYYRHVSTKHVANELDWWIEHRVIRWLIHKHKSGIRYVLRLYETREQNAQHNRNNLAVKDGQGNLIYLYRMSDMPIRIYRYNRPHSNPYLGEKGTILAEIETPIADEMWSGASELADWRDRRIEALERDEYRCQQCGSQENLDVHHRKARKDGGDDSLENLQTLCERCHSQTDTNGRRKD